ncbi:helix-turn-helix domain containing protein [Streptomyces luomodiensis]|uniref:Helix-turn-helix domain containing protein n=1 Tax=Streptomyces luomodiensis TaxID=3026192 RepID=A0ABY9UYP1_9ACTN|nr:helix-turn-helix domain-containing protein [Streptomyces sp. SCA4-21]WNE97117.1 helix-turn-helix domain containing protein [Streptomyces sp. SCA4-21]
MARWQPGAAQRLVVAAVDLFTEQGYDATTVTQIAERAGVTKSTFFRHFSDKRELLVAGQETLSRLLADGITEAPASASPLQAVAAGLERASSAMGPANRELGPRLKAAVAASTELQERDALKSVGLAAAMTAALIARGVPEPTAHLAGELGVLAFKRGYAQWSESDRDDTEGLAPHALAALEDLRAASASLG